jgi:hypothetical protein
MKLATRKSPNKVITKRAAAQKLTKKAVKKVSKKTAKKAAPKKAITRSVGKDAGPFGRVAMVAMDANPCVPSGRIFSMPASGVCPDGSIEITVGGQRKCQCL